MSRRPNIIPLREREKLSDVLADIKEYAADKMLPDRDILLIHTIHLVWHFAEELMNSPAALDSLLATIRVLRASSGPGICSAEEALLNQLYMIGWGCVGWLRENGLSLAPGSTRLHSPKRHVQPVCDVVIRLANFGRECLTYSQPRDNFGGRRRTLAFEILDTIGVILDLPDVVEIARRTVKKGRSDALGASAFLKMYFDAREQQLEEDIKVNL